MIISIQAKCSDLCSTIIKNNNGTVLFEHDGYVPDFMPDEHYGDYILLDIDLKTGKVLNWDTTIEAVKNWIKTTKERDRA